MKTGKDIVLRKSEIDFKLAGELAFGSPFEPLANDIAVAQGLMGGRLRLAPHPEWTMPQQLRWDENPFGEINWVAQYHMMRWIDPLRRAYIKTDNAEFIEKWIEIATSWIKDNPPGKGKAPYAWSDMVEAGRGLTFVFALPQLRQARGNAIDKIVDSLYAHGAWLADPSKIRSGNHALQQHQGLLVIGAVLGDDSWVDLSIDRARKMLLTSYDEQGINEEGALQYHQINYSWWNQLKKRIHLVTGTTPPEFERLEKARDGLLHGIRPDGAYELIGDTEVFRPNLTWSPELQYATTNGQFGTKPVEREKVFSSGYVFGRTGWGEEGKSLNEEIFYSIRFGPQNRIHGHADGGAVTLFRNGESILADAGKYAYDHKDPMRAYVAGRAGHNVLDLRAVEYDTSAEVVLESVHNTTSTRMYCFKDHGYVGHVLQRTVLVDLDNEYIIVIDEVCGPSSLQSMQNWHLGRNFSHRKEGHSVLARSRSNSVWFVPATEPVSVDVVSGQKRPIQGWLSESWREAEASRVITFAMDGEKHRTATLIDFSDAATKPGFSLLDVANPRKTVLRVAREGETLVVVINENRVLSVDQIRDRNDNRQEDM